MAHVDPFHQQRFLCSFCAAEEAISEGLSDSRSASAYTHWKIWSTLCTNATLNPLLLLYKDPILILATFAAEYRHGNISASGKNFCSRLGPAQDFPYTLILWYVSKTIYLL